MQRKPDSVRAGYSGPRGLSRTISDELRRADARRFLLHVAVVFATFSFCTIGILNTTGIDRFAFQIIDAIAMAHATELVHQCVHSTGTGKRRLDWAIGTLLGMPTLLNFFKFQFTHLLHHRHVGTDKDRESFGYAYHLLVSGSRTVRVLGFALHLSMASYYFEVAGQLGRTLRGILGDEHRAESGAMPARFAERVRLNSWSIIAFVVLITTTVVVAPEIALQAWIIPMVLWGPIHALIELPEHVHCDFPDCDPRRNTRTITASRIGRLLTYWNNWHADHHEDARVPGCKLTARHRAADLNGIFAHVESTYPRFYARFIRSLWNGRF